MVGKVIKELILFHQMETKCLIFGANGMLGKYIHKYLETKKDIQVIKITRNEFDIKLASCEKLEKLLLLHSPKFIVNCAGITNKRPDITLTEMYVVNSYFPLILSRFCVKYNIALIHPTTDCVFSGKDGNYNKNFIQDCNDDYGRSKFLGENILDKKICVIRASIIGEEEKSKSSLLSWVISKKGEKIYGYTNHLWNGITCLEYAKIVYKIISEGGWTGLYQIASSFKNKNFISKYELVKIISEIYSLDITVIPFETYTKCDRTLEADIMTKDIYEQIVEMRDFLRS